MTKSPNGILSFPSPTNSLATVRTSSFPPPSKDEGWVGGKRLELLAAPGADQPLEALRVHLSPFLPLHYTLDRCKLSGWVDKLASKRVNGGYSLRVGGPVLRGALSACSTLNNGRSIREVFNEPRFVSVCASNKPILCVALLACMYVQHFRMFIEARAQDPPPGAV